MMDKARVALALSKMTATPKILDAAKLLHFHGLIKDAPASYVKRYIKANPEIQELIDREFN